MLFSQYSNTCKNYKARHHWGRNLWGFIHTICVVDAGDNNYRLHKRAIKKLKVLSGVLPCALCETTYNHYLKKIENLNLSHSMVLFYWSIDLHNAVNCKLGKPILTYDQAVRLWCKN